MCCVFFSFNNFVGCLVGLDIVCSQRLSPHQPAARSSKNLHGLAQQISGDERVERRGPIMLVVRGAPHAASAHSAAAAGRPQVGPAVGAARLGQGGIVGEGGVGGGRAALAAALAEAADNGLDLVLVSHHGQDGGVAQHTVVQCVLSLKQ